MKLVNAFCAAHGIHNWLIIDCLPQLANVPDLLDKVQSKIDQLRYRQHELEQEFNRLNTEKDNDLLAAINHAGEMIEADLASFYINRDD